MVAMSTGTTSGTMPCGDPTPWHVRLQHLRLFLLDPRLMILIDSVPAPPQPLTDAFKRKTKGKGAEPFHVRLNRKPWERQQGRRRQ